MKGGMPGAEDVGRCLRVPVEALGNKMPSLVITGGYEPTKLQK